MIREDLVGRLPSVGWLHDAPMLQTDGAAKAYVESSPVLAGDGQGFSNKAKTTKVSAENLRTYQLRRAFRALSLGAGTEDVQRSVSAQHTNVSAGESVTFSWCVSLSLPTDDSRHVYRVSMDGDCGYDSAQSARRSVRSFIGYRYEEATEDTDRSAARIMVSRFLPLESMIAMAGDDYVESFRQELLVHQRNSIPPDLAVADTQWGYSTPPLMATEVVYGFQMRQLVGVTTATSARAGFSVSLSMERLFGSDAGVQSVPA